MWRLGLCFTALAACAAGQDAVSQPVTPGQLLAEADSVSANFPPEERADLILDLVQANAPGARAQTLEWIDRLLFLCHKQLTPGLYRSAMEKNALTALALIDPKRAAEIYLDQEAPLPPLPSEDFRAYGARTLFPQLWRVSGMKSLPEVERIANALGSSGQYPYAAMTLIIPKVGEKDPEKASELITQATFYLARDPGFPMTNREFIDLLLNTRKLASPGVLRQGVEAELGALAKLSDEDSSKFQYQVRASTTAAPTVIRSEKTFLLYRMSPLIAEVDPKRLEQIEQEEPSLKFIPAGSADGPATIAGAYIPSTDTPASAVESALNQSQTMQIGQLAETDPTAAFQLASQISDPAQQAIAQASILSRYAGAKAGDANSSLTSLADAADKMKPGAPKLTLLCHLATAYAALHRSQDALSMFQKAMDLGEGLYTRYMDENPGKMSYTANGFDDLTGLVEAVSADPDALAAVAARVRLVEDDLLRARLLVFVAKGMNSRKAA